jgi:predicted GNAT family N-acyltransferase
VINIQEIPYASAAYEASKRFRDELLRLPLGLKLSARDVDGEEAQIHIAAVRDGTIVGIVLLKPLSARVVKLRQMAVGQELQGTGMGRKLVRYAEALALARGFVAMETHARVSARGFYEKLGYEAMGEEFTEATVANIKMTKAL